MAKNDSNHKKNEKKSTSQGATKNSKKRLDISALAVIDNMVYSKTDVWAYFKLKNDVFDFLSTSQKASLALQITSAFNNLMSDKQDPVDCHLIATSIPVDVDAWVDQVRDSAESWEQSPGFERFLQGQIAHLQDQSYMKRVCYFGINIGRRGALDMSGLNVLEAGFRGAMDTFKLWIDSIMQQPGEIISAKEEKSFRRKEAELFTTLKTGHLQAERCSSEELLLLIKRQFYPAMPTPYLDIDHGNRLGPGDIDLETCSVIEHKYRWMRFVQMYGDLPVEGYRATMSFAKFPARMNYPFDGFPFLYFPAKLGAPFTEYARLRLFPSVYMKKEVEKKRKEQKDELENIAGAQDAFSSAVSNVDSEVGMALEDLHTISDMLATDKTPWLEGSYHIVVEATNEQALKEYCSSLKQSYDDLGILTLWTAGDQADMFLEQMPGDHLRISSFKQVTNLAMLATSGFNFSSDVGDKIKGTDAV